MEISLFQGMNRISTCFSQSFGNLQMFYVWVKQLTFSFGWTFQSQTSQNTIYNHLQKDRMFVKSNYLTKKYCK